jgi:hypothetical protein
MASFNTRASIAFAGFVMMLLAGCSQFENAIEDIDLNAELPVVNTSNGVPAESANVSIVPVGDLKSGAGTVYTTITDSNGQFTIPTLSDGLYNIIIRSDTLVAFQDSVFIGLSGHSPIDELTLMEGADYSAFIRLQQNHDPQSVTVNILGWDICQYNVDADGYCLLKNMPEMAELRIQCVSTIEGYTPTYKNITVSGDGWDGYIDTVAMIYTGIPIITGLKIWFDSSSNYIQASWDIPTGRNLFDYAVYFDSYYQPLAAFSNINNLQPVFISEPFFNSESIYYNYYYTWGFDSWTSSFSEDSTLICPEQKAAVTVAVRNNSLETGALCKPQEISFHTPDYYMPRFSWSVTNYTRPVDSAYWGYGYYDIYSGDSISITISAFDHGRSIVYIKLQDLSIDSRKTSVKKAGECHNLSSKLKTRVLADDYTKSISCTVKDDAGTEWCDTLDLWVSTPYYY